MADLSLDKEALGRSGDPKKRLELVALKAAIGQMRAEVRLQRAASVPTNDDGGVELPL